MSTAVTPPSGADTQPRADAGRGSRSRAGSVRGGWRIVAAREIAVKLTDKAWLISTLVTTLLLIGSFAASAWFGGQSEPTSVAVTSPQAAAMVRTAEQATGQLPGVLATDYEMVDMADDAAARAALSEGEVDMYLHRSGSEWVLSAEGDPGTAATPLSAAVANSVVNENAIRHGTNLQALSENAQLRVEDVGSADGQASEDEGIARVAGIVFAFIFYMSSLVFGMTIAQSVVEEKQSRLAEIIATSVPMSSMLAGKVIGNTVLAFAQVLLYVAVALVGISFTDIGSMLPALPSAVWWFLAFFVVGFVALAAMWAVAGSLASRQEDVGYTSTPMMTIVIIAFILPFFAEGVWLTVASYVPILSSVAMPMRVVAGLAQWWEPVLALAITAVAAYLLIRLGGRLYRNTLLRTGGRISYREAMTSVD